MEDVPTDLLIAAGAGLTLTLVMCAFALRASASDDFDINHQMNWERHKENLPRRHRRITRVRQALMVLGTICLWGVMWSTWVFMKAAEPGKDPDYVGVAIFVVAIGVFGVGICTYQAAHMFIKGKAIAQLLQEKE